MNEEFNTINNFYGTTQFYHFKDDNTNIIYNLKTLNNVIIINNEVIMNIEGGKSIKEKFKSAQEAEEFFMYLLISFSEGSRIVSREIFRKNK